MMRHGSNNPCLAGLSDFINRPLRGRSDPVSAVGHRDRPL